MIPSCVKMTLALANPALCLFIPTQRSVDPFTHISHLHRTENFHIVEAEFTCRQWVSVRSTLYVHTLWYSHRAWTYWVKKGTAIP